MDCAYRDTKNNNALLAAIIKIKIKIKRGLFCSTVRTNKDNKAERTDYFERIAF
jgi:hypothetical protein